jgi:branched-chain amino acid transport system permease protein
VSFRNNRPKLVTWKTILFLGAAAALAALPQIAELGHTTDVIFYVFLYVILGQSFNIMAGYTGLVSLGHAAFFGSGVIIGRLLWIWGVPFSLSVLSGGIAAALLSIIIGVPCLRLRGAYFAMGTLALTIIGFHLTTNIFITESFLPPAYMRGYDLTARYYTGLVSAVAATLIVFILPKTRLGVGMIAIREDELAAKSIGIGVFKCKLMSLLISAFLAGIAGGTFAFYQVALYFYQGFSPIWSFEPIFVTFIGGPGTLLGPILGSSFYVVLRELFAFTVGQAHIVIFGILFIIIVLAFPRGLHELWKRSISLSRSVTKSHSSN